MCRGGAPRCLGRLRARLDELLEPPRAPHRGGVEHVERRVGVEQDVDELALPVVQSREHGREAALVVSRRELRPRLDELAEFLRAERLPQDLAARLVNGVAMPFTVVHAQDRLDVAEKITLGEERPDGLREVRDAAEPAAASCAAWPSHFFNAR